MPRLTQIDIPEFSVWGVPLYGEKPVAGLAKTVPQALSDAEQEAVRLSVRSAFPEAKQVRFFPLRSGREPSGRVAVCGMSTVDFADGTAKTRLFRGYIGKFAAPGHAAFRLTHLAGTNAHTFDVYSDCQAQGLA